MALSIEVRDLSFSYGPTGRRLEHLSLAVPEASLCCLLGPNGAGKTTLLRCLLGMLKPHAGSVRIAGQDIADLSARQLARLVAYVPQNTTTVFPFTTLEMALMGRTPALRLMQSPSRADRRMALVVLDQLEIGHLAARPFAQLSGGERQLTLVARALVQEAPVLILDEPTASLDYGNEVRLLRVVTDLVTSGRSVFMTTHQPNHALMWADTAVLMRLGSVLAVGPPASVITSERLSALYDVPIRVERVPSWQPDMPDEWICLPQVVQPPLRARDNGHSSTSTSRTHSNHWKEPQ